jgi:cell division septation protein DedD
VRPTEDAARAAYDQLADKFATDIGGKPATVTQAQVNGRSVFRVRVTPLSREEANTLCTRLKASGGQCFVVAN